MSASHFSLAGGLGALWVKSESKGHVFHRYPLISWGVALDEEDGRGQFLDPSTSFIIFEIGALSWQILLSREKGGQLTSYIEVQ